MMKCLFASVRRRDRLWPISTRIGEGPQSTGSAGRGTTSSIPVPPSLEARSRAARTPVSPTAAERLIASGASHHRRHRRRRLPRAPATAPARARSASRCHRWRRGARRPPRNPRPPSPAKARVAGGSARVPAGLRADAGGGGVPSEECPAMSTTWWAGGVTRSNQSACTGMSCAPPCQRSHQGDTLQWPFGAVARRETLFSGSTMWHSNWSGGRGHALGNRTRRDA